MTRSGAQAARVLPKSSAMTLPLGSKLRRFGQTASEPHDGYAEATNGKARHDHPPGETQPRSVVMGLVEDEGYQYLRGWAEMYYDQDQAVTSMGNRIDRAPVGKEAYLPQFKMAKQAKAMMEKALIEQFRLTVPPGVQEWVEHTPGIGETGIGRLLGHTGHPLVAFPSHWEGKGNKRVQVADTPFVRTLGDYRSYAGHGDPARSRRKGMTEAEARACGNPMAKAVTRMVAMSAIREKGRNRSAWQPRVETESTTHSAARRSSRSRAHSASSRTTTGNGKSLTSQPAIDIHTCPAGEALRPYRRIYEQRRRDTYDRPWSDLHKHHDALRIVGKVLLKDIWIAAHD